MGTIMLVSTIIVEILKDSPRSGQSFNLIKGVAPNNKNQLEL